MIKRKNILISAVIAVVSLVAGIFIGMLIPGSSVSQESKITLTGDKDSVAIIDGEKAYSGESYDFPENLVFTQTSAMIINDDNTVSVELVATVLPEDATNKKVDWEIRWAASTVTDDVTDYVTVTPSSDGSTTATVTCKRAFVNDILVIVTTRDGGHMAYCVVQYAGKPSSINISSDINSDDGVIYSVPVGTHTFDIELDNVFNDVSSVYKKGVVFEVTGVGEFKDGSLMDFDNQEDILTELGTNLSLDLIKDEILNITYDDNGVLTVEVKQNIESYKSEGTRYDDMGYTAYQHAFVSFVDGIDCYFEIKVEHPDYNISDTIKLYIDPTAVASVTLSESELEF